MPEEAKKDGTPPAGNGGIDMKALGELIAQQVAAAIKPVADQVAELGKAKAPEKPEKPAEPAQQAKSLTAEDVQRIVGESLKSFAASTQQAEGRKGFIAEKLKDLPAVYQNQLGNDPAKWAEQEQQIRTQYQADFKAAGGKVAEVDGAAGTSGAAKPNQTVDTSKLSAVQLMEMGLKESKPVGAKAAEAGKA